MAEKCFGCISLKTLDDICSPDLRCHDNKSSCPTSRGSTTRSSLMLRIIHVGGDEEVFTGPKYASELLKQYPDHCVTFPDIFTRPWAVVNPERMLLPGEKFCLVPTSIVQTLQYDLLQKLHSKALADHNSGGIISKEILTGNWPRSLCMTVEEKLGISDLEFYTRSEDDCIKDIKKSTENEEEESLAKSAYSLKYVEIENGMNNLQRAYTPPIRRRRFASYSWSPELEPIQEIRSPAENI